MGILRVVTGHVQRQIDEIRDDWALRLYGGCLLGAQALAFVFWIWARQDELLADASSAISWPFFEDSFKYRYFEAGQIRAFFYAGVVLSVLGSLLFLFKRLVGMAWFWLFAMDLCRMLVWAQDYRLRLNQHYFTMVFVFVFLFLPHKRLVLRYLLAFVYFWAGILKLNTEWLSGAGLYRAPLGIPESLIPASCWYVVLLECVFIWGALAKNRLLFWSTGAQLLAFHIVSWPVVGFYYPMLMFLILSIFVLTRFINADRDPDSLLQAFFTRKTTRVAYVVVLVFSAGQMVPKVMPGDYALTCQGRLFAMHMFDAKSECEGAITLRFKDGTKKVYELPTVNIPRLKSDPAVYFSMAKRLVWEHRDDPNFVDLDYYLRSRRTTDTEMKTLVDIRDFKKQNLSYTIFWPNSWIRTDYETEPEGGSARR